MLFRINKGVGTAPYLHEFDRIGLRLDRRSEVIRKCDE
jgi:hypothetical protein